MDARAVPPAADRTRRWLRALGFAAAFAAGLAFLALVLGRLHAEWGFLRLSCRGAAKPFLFLGALLAARYALAWRAQDPAAARRRAERDLPWLLFLVSFALFTGVRDRLVDLRTPHDEQCRHLTGDEPSYMLICQSLVLDGDVNLFNDGSRGRKGATFGCPSAGPHKARADVEKGYVYSIHSPGLPALLAPFFRGALALGVPPRFACAVALNLFAAVGIVLLYGLCRRFGSGPWPAAAATLAVAAASPVLTFAHQVYPDLPAAVVVLAGYALLPPGDGDERRALGVARLFGVGVCVAFLPWLHIRLAVFSVGLLIAAGVTRWRRPAELAAALAPALVSAVWLLLSYRAWYGSFSPSAAYAAQASSAMARASPTGMALHAVGMLFDGGRGLLPWSPFFLFAPAGLWFAWRARRAPALWLAAPTLAYLALVASFDLWWGGFCPQNRFWLPAVPLLGVSLAALLQANPRPALRAAFALAALAAAAFVFRAVAHDYAVLYTKRHVLQTVPVWKSAWAIQNLLPDIRRMPPLTLYKAGGALVLCALANAWAAWPPRRKRTDGAASPPPAPEGRNARG